MRRSSASRFRAGLLLVCLALASTALAASGEFVGKVVETMSTDSYTYVRVNDGKTDAWAAAPRFDVSVGERVAFATGMPMKDFKSETLKRTFDVVYFTGEIRKLDAAASAAPAPAMHKAPAAPAAPMAALAPPAGGTAISALVAKPGDFAGKRVTVKGKVVKYNANILGKNWLHLRDGSAAEGAPDGADDICVTTANVAKLGDIVVATGVVSTGKDFGAGYRYDVIIEEATLAQP